MTQVDEWTPMVLEKLTATLGDEAPKLIALLKETGAILSGGFVLNSIVKYDTSVTQGSSAPDLDMYVPLANMPRFLGALVKDTLKLQTWRHFDATIYCRSFLRKNGIRRVHTFATTEGKSVDVMAVRTRKTVQDVCSNFDLTFCQVWFDGTHVFATHPDHIRSKKGFLQGEYIDTFVKGNTFLKDRIRKYQRRGFTVEYDPSTTSIKLPVIDDVLQYIPKCSKDEAREVLLPVWFQRAATRWLVASKKTREKFILPFGKSSAAVNQDFAPGTKNVFGTRGDIENFSVLDDEGYDSESMDAPKLTSLAAEKYVAPVLMIGEREFDLAAKPLDPALILGRQMFGMLYAALTESPQKEGDYSYRTLNFKEVLDSVRDIVGRLRETLRALEAGERVRTRWTIAMLKPKIQEEERRIAKSMQFVDYLHTHATRVGTDFAADDGQLYDIHYHPMDAATTRDSLEGYLEQYIRLQDKSNGVPCYHKPTPAVRGQREPATNCTQNITMKQIETIVSYEFFKRFSAAQPMKTGLNAVMPLYEAALPNTKELEEGYGAEYHETMCPFCLQPMSRGEGCSYMTHENPKRLDSEQAPFCQKEFVVEDLLETYKAMAHKIQPDLPVHLEVCVECGRPCLGHQHFDILSPTPALVPAKMMPDPANPGRMTHDYATCAGGGRTELFARMLAVRDTYKNAGITNPKEERTAAAKAADAAAKDPVFLARGKAIADMPPAERKFNTKVPAVKKYDDPSYDDVSEENAQKAANAAVNAAENAALAALAAVMPAAPAAPAANEPAPAAQNAVVFPDRGEMEDLRTYIEPVLATPFAQRPHPFESMKEFTMKVGTSFGIDEEILEEEYNKVIDDMLDSDAYLAWNAAYVSIVRGVPVANYDQLWANVCIRYVNQMWARLYDLAPVGEGGARRKADRKARKNTYKRRGLAFTRRGGRKYGRVTYKKRKVQRKTRRN